MKFTEILSGQAKRHPAILPQDVVKLCYQAAYGVEHLIGEPEAVKGSLLTEFEACGETGEPLYELISSSYCRVNLGAWKKRGLSSEWLFNLFLESAGEKPQNALERFQEYIREAELLIREGIMNFDAQAWQAYLKEYPCGAPAAVHHSARYRVKETPAYRLVSSRYIPIFPVLEAVSGRKKSPCVIAIDGRAGAGKSTLASALSRITGAGVVHMDDFFLPEHLRTRERLLEPGGNVDYERFQKEVLPHLGRTDPFSYQKFDCSRMKLGESREIPGGELLIVEGAYSAHPKFGRYMELLVFCDVSQEEQRARIEKRNGKEMLTRFVREWIPMEETYFTRFKIGEKADLIL